MFGTIALFALYAAALFALIIGFGFTIADIRAKTLHGNLRRIRRQRKARQRRERKEAKQAQRKADKLLRELSALRGSYTTYNSRRWY